MHVYTFPLGQLQANCYILVEGNTCIIIDPADSADFILEKITRQNLTPIAMLATHGHFDHIMAAGEIQLSFDLPLYIHDADLFLVKRLNKTAEHFLGFNPTALPPRSVGSLTPGTLSFGAFTIQVLHTPGHTPGSCSFYIPTENMVFTGDTLFKDGIGAYDHAYSDKKLLFQSLTLLHNLPQDTIVYPGHGEETLIGEEQNEY